MKVRHTTARSCALWGLLCSQWRIPCIHLDEEGTLWARDLLSWLCLVVSVVSQGKCQNLCAITRQMLSSTSYWSKVLLIVTLLNSVNLLLWKDYCNESLEKLKKKHYSLHKLCETLKSLKLDLFIKSFRSKNLDNIFFILAPHVFVGAHKCLADTCFRMEVRRMDTYGLYSNGENIEPTGKTTGSQSKTLSPWN